MPEDIQQRTVENKRRLYQSLYSLAGCGEDGLKKRVEAVYAGDVTWRGSHPLNEMAGADAVLEQVWQPMLRAFPDIERRDLIFVGGRYQERDMVAAVGHYCGTMRRSWLGVPATGRPVYLRYGEVHHVEDGRVAQSWCLWDILDFLRQTGVWPIAPSLGWEGMWPGPITADGVVLTAQDEEESRASIRMTLDMHGALAAFDDRAGLSRELLLDMPQKDHWHPKMMWYGPSGIGTTRGLQGFVDYHQLPFRVAFPNRKGGDQWLEMPDAMERLGGGHYIQIGDGKYAVTGGWPSVYCNHEGGDFLGVPSTGREITMRVMDFYLIHEGKIRENWVPLDVLNVLKQMGADPMERLAEIRTAREA